MKRSKPCSRKGGEREVAGQASASKQTHVRRCTAHIAPCPFLLRGVANATCAPRHPPPYLAPSLPSSSSASTILRSSYLLSPLQVSSACLARAICSHLPGELKVVEEHFEG